MNSPSPNGVIAFAVKRETAGVGCDSFLESPSHPATLVARTVAMSSAAARWETVRLRLPMMVFMLITLAMAVGSISIGRMFRA